MRDEEATNSEEAPATAPPVLSVRAVDKRFGGVHALKSVSLDILPGEIHALVGENGAGKSTLMRVLTGAHPPDSGSVLIDGAEIRLASPQDAFARGIAMVWQDTRLAMTLDVAWNISLCHEPGGRVLVDRAAMLETAQRALARIGSGADPLALPSELSRAQMQQVEIARALSRSTRVLILDEPTSALTPAETEGLFQVLAELRAAGTAIVFISHRIPEVQAIADRVTVMKDGVITGTLSAQEATEARIVSMMVGREMGLDFPPRATAPGDVILQVSGLRTAHARDIAFEVRAGEIVGFGGIEGSGQQQTARALFGLGIRGGEVRLNGHPVPLSTPAQAIAAGMIYVPADRQREGLFPIHSIRENAALPNVGGWTRRGLIDAGREAREVAAQMQGLQVKAPGPETLVGALSGGNQQKVVFARWFIGASDVYILDEPTQGVDVETKMELYGLIRRLAEGGAAVVVVSSDLPELIGLTDRILVFSAGRIAADLRSAGATEEGVMRHAVGAAKGDGDGVRDRHASGPDGTAQGRAAVRRRPLLQRYLPGLLLLALVVLIAFAASLAAPYFLTPRNFASMGGQIAPLAIAALGQMSTILLGGIDLSVGPTISLVTAIASYLLSPESGVPITFGVLACLCAGIAVGALNAALTTVLRIPDLVATLATFSVVQGIALIVRPAPGGRVSGEFADAVTMRLGMVPVVFVVAVVLYVVAETLLLRGRLGARFYATGGNVASARAAGIATDRLRAGAYLFSGLMAAVAGLIIAARIGSGDPQAGTTFTLSTVTAVVVGGTLVFGGVGTAVGTMLGAILIILMQNVLNQLYVSAYWQYVWTGALTLVAVGFHGLRTPERRAAMRAAAGRLVARQRAPIRRPGPPHDEDTPQAKQECHR
ncbi:ATP-binding cassette domain-containing protein [Tropicimonas sp. IMCC6043]|uniref:ATP-binding cassette domain-containing protein n=1 Tax=Tropicimonas sp. IMCC6043 TaxID=2510645 RepID=UPI0013E99EC1|nr:ATP-binding cassette domain-containing protein [Tropicimonas sp. IMCC6043]